MKVVARILAMGVFLALLAAQQGHAGRMFGTKTVTAPPKWCFCARVCAGFSRPPTSHLVPPGQSLAICPGLHDELIYDNRANCGCTQGAPVEKRPQTSPNR